MAEITEHAFQRIKERLDRMTSMGDITPREDGYLTVNLGNVLKYNFNPKKSFGINLGRFNINPKSGLVTEKHKSGTYYEINSAGSDDIVKDSTGNEFWVIVRNNNLITAFLRKTVQRQTATQPRDMGGLGVDVVINDFNKFLTK